MNLDRIFALGASYHRAARRDRDGERPTLVFSSHVRAINDPQRREAGRVYFAEMAGIQGSGTSVEEAALCLECTLYVGLASMRDELAEDLRRADALLKTGTGTET